MSASKTDSPAIFCCRTARLCARTKPIRRASKAGGAQLETRNLELKGEAETVAEKLDGQSFVIIRQAGETGQLYGSVSTRDIAQTASAGGFTVNRNQIVLTAPIKTLGLHPVPIHLHPEVIAKVTVNVARSPEEAERQTKGEMINVREDTSMEDLGLEVGRALEDAGGSLGDR